MDTLSGQRWKVEELALGLVAIGAAVAFAIAHFAYGLPIFVGHTEQLASDMSIAAGLTFMAAVGLLFVLHRVGAIQGRPKQNGN